MRNRNVFMWIIFAMFLVAFLAVTATSQVWAAPLLGITPTPTPGSPPPPAEIPEPVTLALMGAGVAGLIGYVRSRQK